MKKIINWFKQSNRWKHFSLGFLVGLFTLNWYCMAYTGVGVASALEFKDKLWGGKWDWIDWGLTVGGVALGFLVQLAFVFLVFKGHFALTFVK